MEKNLTLNKHCLGEVEKEVQVWKISWCEKAEGKVPLSNLCLTGERRQTVQESNIIPTASDIVFHWCCHHHVTLCHFASRMSRKYTTIAEKVSISVHLHPQLRLHNMMNAELVRIKYYVGKYEILSRYDSKSFTPDHSVLYPVNSGTPYLLLHFKLPIT